VNLTLKPGAEGQDALIFSREDQKDKNFGNSAGFNAATWTWNADGLGTGSYRSLLRFDLDTLPAGASLVSAKLYLFADTINFTHGHSSLSASNAATLLRVKAAWAETTVTWSNQPPTDTAGSVKLEESGKAKQDYVLDVKAMIQDMYAHPATNFGFLLRTQAETPYNAMTFASSDHADSALRPALKIEYQVPETLDVITLKPGADGKDAVIFSREDQKDKNFGNSPAFSASNWTWNADGLGSGTYRSLIEFDLKPAADKGELKAAILHLKCDTANYTHGHSSLSAGNAAWLLRVKEPWAETTVTWSNQPPTDTAGKIALAQSKGAVQDYDLDVTDMVADMLAHPEENHGFLLRTQAETPYNAISFASGDHADSALRPELELRFSKATVRVGHEGFRRLAHAGAPSVRLAGNELVLDRGATGLVADVRGNIVARFGKAGKVSLRGFAPGAYVLKAEGLTYRFVTP
jgi:hypothetical protein